MNSVIKQLEDVTMEEDDIDVYSSPYENYLRLVQTIESLESGIRLTEDWYEEHKKHILKYISVFPDFGKVNGDIEEKEFRRKAKGIEVMLADLVNEIRITNTFNTKIYLILNKYMKEACEFIWGEDELLRMMKEMGV